MRAQRLSLLALGLALLVVIALASAPGLPSPTLGPSQPPPTSVATMSGGPSAGPSASAAAPASPSPTAVASAPSGGQVPAFGHVFVVVMENREATAIIGNPDAPYINALARRYGLATNYRAVAHPSEPNYLALWSGSTQGVTNDGVYNFAAGRTLADEVEASGRSWHVAAENVPLGCYTGSTASGGPDGSGTYARKHEPAISWTSVSGNAARCARITDFSHFDPNLGDLWFVAPNLCHDMHDCSIATGDAFLRSWLPGILTSAAFGDGVVFLTWDEGTTATGGGGRVATIVMSPLVKGGSTSATSHSHYSLLRTIEDAWGLPCLARACDANDLQEFFR
ncbi:MAG TPA: alkaline phosphatase family protein [Candidatus Limnocylindrales bacterium]|nr:alkaline phosphatase family protein [Candidatus Limnocylindrales bacterium]